MFKERSTAMLGTLVLALFLSSLILTNPGKPLAADAFLKIDVIPGESRDNKHINWIDVISWSFGETQSGTATHAAAGAGAGRATMKDFKFTMRTNKASPKLFLACAKGEHLKSVKLEAVRPGKGDKMKFLEVTLEDVLVTSFLNMGSSGTGGADAVPLEEILLNFSKITFGYVEQKADGSAGSATQAVYDVKQNKAY